MPSPQTRSGTPKLSEVARKVVVPDGIVSTGWPAVRDLCRIKLGVHFDPWQDATGRVIMAKRADGKLAVMIGGVGMSLPRQVGKTYLIGALVFALCILRPGMLVIWSAHHARTHGETFLAMQAFADRAKVKPYIRQVFTGSGDEEIRFLNGSRILFGARERGFGRGIPGVDMIVSDEAQIMSEKALDAQLATMNTSRFGLAIYVGTPPRPDDPSDAFTRMRSDAWAGRLLDAAWIEFGAEATANPHDRKQWARANPSYPARTPVESILRLQRKLSAESFLREGLGIWDEESSESAIPAGSWSQREAREARTGDAYFALDVSPKMTDAAIAVAGLRGNGDVFGQLLKRKGQELLDYRPGVDWVLPALIDLKTRVPELTLAIVKGSQAESLAPDIEAAGISVEKVPTAEMVAACGLVYSLVTKGGIWHAGQPELTESIKATRWRDVGEGGQAWGRRKSTLSITPTFAYTLAVAQAKKGPTGLTTVVMAMDEEQVDGFDHPDSGSAAAGDGDRDDLDTGGDHHSGTRVVAVGDLD